MIRLEELGKSYGSHEAVKTCRSTFPPVSSSVF